MKTIKEQMQEAEQFARDNLRALCREAVDKTHGSTDLPLTVQLRNMIPMFGITPIMLADEARENPVAPTLAVATPPVTQGSAA